MSIILLIPGLISLFLVWQGLIETAFLAVYLPCLLCLPDSFQVRLPHLPPISTAQFALIPLAAVGFYRLIRNRSFALTDVLVPLFTASVGLSEILHSSTREDGIFAVISTTISILLPYVAGRTLIEPDIRLNTVRMFVLLALVDMLPGLYEWKTQQSLYMKLVGLLGVPATFVQVRNGFGRLGSVFSGGESAGIAYAMILCLNAWLVYLRRTGAPVDLGKTLGRLQKYHVADLLLFSCVLLTQSRGPLMSLAAGYLILQIPRFKRTKTMTMVVAALFVAGYFAASAHFASYAEIADQASLTEQQSSAVYRIKMNTIYPPIAEAGGWTGWGLLEIPQIDGINSLDNHYLLVHLAWGRLGYIFFVLIVWENIRVLLARSWKFTAMEDRAFIFSMLAAMAVLWLTLMTVYLGGQLPQIAFLLVGWIQSTVPGRTKTYSVAQTAENLNVKFAFRRVLT